MKKNAFEIKNHFNPATYKEKADLEVSKLKIIKALKAVLDTDQYLDKKSLSDKYRVASLSFDKLLDDMDQSHYGFTKMLKTSRLPDKEELLE